MKLNYELNTKIKCHNVPHTVHSNAISSLSCNAAHEYLSCLFFENYIKLNSVQFLVITKFQES